MPIGICDHCGTVILALIPPPAEETKDCPCLCHQARQQRELERAAPKKRGKKR